MGRRTIVLGCGVGSRNASFFWSVDGGINCDIRIRCFCFLDYLPSQCRKCIIALPRFLVLLVICAADFLLVAYPQHKSWFSSLTPQRVPDFCSRQECLPSDRFR